MDSANLPQALKIIVEQDMIDSYKGPLRIFFEDIFEMDSSKVFVTDLSTLSDYAFSGNCPHLRPKTMTLTECYNAWDAWVLPRICSRYKLEANSFTTRITLIQLMALIETQAFVTLH